MNHKSFSNFKQFITFPIHISAFTNEEGKVKKDCSLPPGGWQKLTQSKPIDLVYKKGEGKIKPNGIGIVVENSGLSAIDIDRPEKCRILEQLKTDCGFWVQTKNGFHFYFKKEDVLERQKRCGVADINTGLLYYCPTYSHKDTGEEYHYKLMKSGELTEMPQYAIDWCIDLIATADEVEPKKVVKKGKKNTEEKIVIRPDLEIAKFDLKTVKDIVEILYDAKVLHKYNGWRDTAYMIRHINNSEESYKIFDKYSKLVAEEKCKAKGLSIDCEKYKKKTRPMFFGNGEYNLNFDENGVLIKCGKINPEKFKTCLQYLYKSKWEDELTHMNFQFIYPDDKSNDAMFNDWMRHYKCLGIRSAYGTGKSYGFKKLIERYGFERVLFITYRQSLAHSLILELREKFNFVSYLDEDVSLLTANRLIIQLDSIKKLNGGFNLFTQQDGMPKYDLIILDEIEGTLNHLSFESIDQHSIHNYLVRLIKKAPKVLALDGDMSDRSYDFISDLCPSYKFYVNDYKPNKKHFLFTHNLNTFNKAIESDLANGKRIVVASMTKAYTERLKIQYESKYKVIIHNSIEKNKDILMNVNEEWTKCDLLVYSPSVESGVDFNIRQHFYRCYGVLESDSTTYRAFNQMLNRVRYYEKDEIMCLMSEKMIYRVNEILYRFDEMRMTKYFGLEQNNLIDILIHNDTERINSTNYFMCSFINAITAKGHTHKYLNDKPQIQKQSISVKKHTMDAISNAKNIDGDTAQYLQLQSKKNCEITRDEHYSLEKYHYSRIFKTDIDEINPDWLEDRYDKKHIPRNYEKMIGYRYDDEPDKILKNFEMKKIDEMKNILLKIGFIISKNEIIKEKAIPYNNAFEYIKTKINTKEFKTLFNNSRQVRELNVLSIFNESLENYGFELKKKKLQGKRAIPLAVGADGVSPYGKREIDYEYSLEYTEIIADYREMKNEELQQLENEV